MDPYGHRDRSASRGRAIDLLRGLTAAGVLLSAVVHLLEYLSGFRDVSVIGPLFLLNAVAGAVLGVVVLVWRHWVAAFLAAGFGAVTVAAYWYSVVFGLFGFQETYVTGWPVILAEIGEYVAVACGLTATAMLWRHLDHRRAPVRRHAEQP